MSKWTDWIPHEGEECPVDGEEVVKVKSPKGCTGKGPAKHWAWYGSLATLTHYKRLRKNVEAEEHARFWDDAAENNASEPETPNPATTPAPIITGPGEYVTRRGEKITIEYESRDEDTLYFGPLYGCFCTWCPSGKNYTPGNPSHDITGPWQEPEKPETKPERWIAVYKGCDSELWMGGLPGSREDINRQNAVCANYVGAIKMPLNTEKPERWANLYRDHSDHIMLGRRRETNRDNLADFTSHSACKHIGFVLLNPEEE